VNTNQQPANYLPTKGSLRLIYVISSLITVLMGTASFAGLLYRESIYPSEEMLRAFMPNDVINLAIGVPMMIVSMWLTRKGNIIGLLFWPGALFYVFYVYIVYLLSMPYNLAFLFHLSLVVLSAYTMVGLLASIDGKVVQAQLRGRVAEKLCGGVLVGLGMLFFVRVAGIFASTLINQTVMPATELALNVADFVLSPAMVIGGVLLWRSRSFGYVSGLGLLFQGSMLFIGLIFTLILQPFISGAAFMLVDTLVVFVMGMICFVPFALFLQGAMLKGKPSSGEIR
jgi:hypothetical protein